VHRQTKASLLLVVSIGLAITTLSLSYDNWQLREQLEETPKCQDFGHKGYDITAYNTRNNILSFRCTNNESAGVELRSIYPKPPIRTRPLASNSSPRDSGSRMG